MYTLLRKGVAVEDEGGEGYLGEATLLGSLAHFARVSLQHAPILLTMLLILRPSITLHFQLCKLLTSATSTASRIPSHLQEKHGNYLGGHLIHCSCQPTCLLPVCCVNRQAATNRFGQGPCQLSVCVCVCMRTLGVRLCM